jgi:putative nucleotidyltransferase with HDIG domain
MEYPGVVSDPGLLVPLQERGFTIHDVVTGQERNLSDWTDLRDVQEARDFLIQREHELTLVDAEDKTEILRFLSGFVVHNTILDLGKTDANENTAKRLEPEVLLQVKKGRTIVRRGDAITQQTLAQLNRLKELKQQESWKGRVFGVLLIVGFFLLVLWLYFQIYQRDQQRKSYDFLLVVLLLLVGLVITRAYVALAELVAGSLKVESLQDPIHFYFVAPFSLGSILTILLLGVNATIFFSLVFALFVGIFTGELSVTLYVLTSSIAAIHALRQYRERSAIVRAGMIIGAVNVVIALALQLYSSQGDFQWVQFMVRTGAGILSGLSAAMLTSLFLPVLESLFGLTTDIRLLELSNLNSPLLRRLALEAPGTYHHSITVGTLAEAGAEEIGANGLLTRVGAYYHDIGKLKHPEYYIENQVFTGNKHESLAPTMSTLILTSHVKDGLAIAEEVGLGPKVRDLIPQHHGTRIMTYFFQKAREAAEEKGDEINENDFRYPGPKPQFKEAAILMLADQVEAAARTLQDPSPGQIRSLIRRITQSTIQDGQFNECDITLKEVSRVGDAFERVLNGMYHHRIEYPGFEFNKRVEERQTENQRIQ